MHFYWMSPIINGEDIQYIYDSFDKILKNLS